MFSNRTVKHVYLLIVLMLCSCAGPGNIVFQDRFSGDLSAWKLSGSDESVSITIKDNSLKMKLNAHSPASSSASRTFTEPSGNWILEYDINFASEAAGAMELLDSGDHIIATVDCGSIADTISFSTDAASASTAPFIHDTYKKIVIVVNKSAAQITAYRAGDDAIYSPLQIIGSAKSYSGATVAAIRFRTGNHRRGEVYLDEIVLYTPVVCMIGDSITDGKYSWSWHPNYAGRISADYYSYSPSYKLGNLLDEIENIFVADRATGGSDTSDINTNLQATIIEHGCRVVYIGIGHNDIYPATVSLETMKSNMISILNKLRMAGIRRQNIILGNVFPSRYIDTEAKKTLKSDWNNWLKSEAESLGAHYVDLNTLMKSHSEEDVLNPAYSFGDGTHLNEAGNTVLAKAIYDAVLAIPAVCRTTPELCSY